MVKNCSAFGCANRINKCKPGIHFHRIPQDLRLRRWWMIACGRPDWNPGRHTYLCSDHFDLSCYSSTITSKAKLKPNACPTIFSGMPPLISKSVEFKPEMWGERIRETEEKMPDEPPIKRGRGRPRKHVSNNTRVDGNVVIKSEAVPCCALACTNTSESFIMNCLPRDPAMRKLWVERIDRLDWTPDEDSALCEIHFEEDMWDHDLGEEKILKPDALPSMFLHGEAIKSWVTMDHTGNIENIVIDGHSTNDENSNNESSNQANADETMSDFEEEEEESPAVFVKREALEPEIDMVEGSEEDMVSREASSTGEQFETIYCDSTFNDQEDSEDGEDKNKENKNDCVIVPISLEEENPLAPDTVLQDERSSTPILQDGQVSCLEDSTKTQQKGKKVGALKGESKYLVISMPTKESRPEKKKIRRRSSVQLSDEFQCPICDRRLSRRKNLEIHIEKLHPFGELSEYQRKKKLELEELRKREAAKITPTKKIMPFKKPPPALKPLVPQCLLSPAVPTLPVISLPSANALVSSSAQTPPQGVLTTSFPIISFSSQSPLVSSSIHTSSSPPTVTPAIVPAQSLVTPQPLVNPTSPQNLEPSSNGNTLIATTTMVTTPRPLDPSPAGGEMKKQFLLLLPKQAVVPPLQTRSRPTTPVEQPAAASDKSDMYSVNLSHIPLDKRLKLKDKLRELVDAVVKKKLNPEKIIIAYDRT